MGNTIPVAEDVVEFIKRGNESERIALENLKTIAPVINKQMTEQEKRNSEIAELEKSLPHFISNDTRRFIAVKLINKGYRKEREVQKETLQKLFTAVRNSNGLIEYSEFTTDPEMWAIDFDDLQELIKQEFEVEV